jgi:hypothetical protein
VADLNITAGEDVVLDFGPVQTVDLSVVPSVATPINLRTAGTRLKFMAKRSKADLDADAELVATFEPGVTENDGITVPAAGANNYGTIRISGEQTRDLLDARYLPWELWLHEPGATTRDSKIDSGTLKVARAVRRAAP